MRKVVIAVSVLGFMSLAGCSGVRSSNGTFVAHAESFRILGMPIPADDQQAALDQVPRGGKITNVSATPADWTSFIGILGNIIGFHVTQIGGTLD